MVKCNIGKLIFSTQKKSYEYTKNIIYTLQECIINSIHDNFSFFIDLIQNHHVLLKKDVKYFRIKRDDLNRKAYAMLVIKQDDSEHQFSWVKCSKAQSKEESHKSSLLCALRYSIENQIKEFKNCNELVCCLCFINDIETEYQVDHKNPSFKKLYESFILIYPNIPKFFDKHKTTRQSMFKSRDIKYKEIWQNYHFKNCELQILCKTCNLHKK
jgi:hypothetical protein